jgi:tetratricopeptide (TPR) repeat protein
MNSPFTIALLSLLLVATSGFAARLDEANGQFKAGNFAEAATAYEKILTTEGPRASVFYNLGNSYQAQKQHGLAILAYERAKLLTPRDPDLLANLSLARKAATAFEEPVFFPTLEVVIQYLSRDEWSWLVAGSALLLGALAVFCGWRGTHKFAFIAAGVASLIIAAGTAVLWARRGESERGIILSESATVRLSPFEKAESLGTPGPGKTVRLGAKSGDFQYAEIRAANLRGWLAAKDVAAIETR